MALNDTVKTRILDDIVDTIKGIASGAQFRRTVRRAGRKVLPLTDSLRDMVYVASHREEKSDLAPTVKQVKLYVDLECVVEDTNDVAQAVDDIATDIETALDIDVTRNSLAIDTNVMGSEDYLIEELEPQGVCVVHVQVMYRHVRGDPRTVA